MDLRTIVLIAIFAVGAILFFFRLRYLMRQSEAKRRIQQERKSFLTNFNPSGFTDFDTFTFGLASFSHVEPFPAKKDGEWIFTVFLAKQDEEDVDTIVHEIAECTIGRLIERLLMLKKPLYLIRKQDDKFWLNGRQQKYLPEHILATLSELDNIPKEKLEERIAPEDIEMWQLLGSK